MRDIQSKVYNSQLESQLKEYQKSYAREKQRADKLYECLTTVAEKVCSSVYGENQLGGKNRMISMQGPDLRDFIVDDFQKQRKDYLSIIKEVQDLYLAGQQENDALARQILELKKALADKEEKLRALRTGSPAGPAEPVPEDVLQGQPDDEETPVFGPMDQETPVFDQPPAPADGSIVRVGGNVYDLDEVAGGLNEWEKLVIRAIGQDAASETASITESVSAIRKTSTSAMQDTLRSLLDKKICTKMDAHTAYRPRRNMYALTKLGKKVFRKLYEKKPVPCLAERLAQMHASLEHGVHIMDTAAILKEQGYVNVSYDSSRNTIRVPGDQRYVPDVVAETDKERKTFWEVELCHHKDPEFFDKLDKAARVTNEVYIIVPSEPLRKKMKSQVERYAAYVMMRKDDGGSMKMTLYVGTIKELEKRTIFTDNRCRFEINRGRFRKKGDKEKEKKDAFEQAASGPDR